MCVAIPTVRIPTPVWTLEVADLHTKNGMSDLPPKFAIALHTLAMERHVLNEPKTLTVQVEEIGMFGERLETENLAFNPVRAGG